MDYTPFRLGLVSITFRSLAPHQIVSLVVQAELKTIEWGGDIHVPHGDLVRAAEVGEMTRDAGLEVACYGSYYCVAREDTPSFESVLASAVALGAPLIRVWGGGAGSVGTTDAQFRKVAVDLERICGLAAKQDIVVATEFHGGTYCDTAETTAALLTEVGASNLRTLWQTSGERNIERHLAEIDLLSPWLANVHVFHWQLPERLPLAAGATDWRAYLARLAALARPVGALLEFVCDDSPAQFLADAATLQDLSATP